MERDSTVRHEYYDGEIFAMAGGTDEHSLIVANIIGELRQRLKGCPCAVRDPNLRLKVKATGLRTYPDASVYCGEQERDTEQESADTATNPTVLFEVLSKSTEAYDRGFKSDNYRRIESLKAYILVSQESPHTELYERQSDGSWRFTESKGLNAVMSLPAINVVLPLAEIYDRIKFPESPSPFPRLEQA